MKLTFWKFLEKLQMSRHVTAALQRRALAASKVTDVPLTSWKGDLEFAKLVNTTISECTELTSHLHNVQHIWWTGKSNSSFNPSWYWCPQIKHSMSFDALFYSYECLIAFDNMKLTGRGMLACFKLWLAEFYCLGCDLHSTFSLLILLAG